MTIVIRIIKRMIMILSHLRNLDRNYNAKKIKIKDYNFASGQIQYNGRIHLFTCMSASIIQDHNDEKITF